MTIIAITLLVRSIITLNNIMAFVKNKKKRLISLIISTAVSIATIIVTYLSIPIAKPIVLPLDGMLTEDYPFVEFKYPNCLNHFFPKKDF